MSALLQFYWAVAVPVALILLGVAIYLLTLPDNEADNGYGVDDYAAPVTITLSADTEPMRGQIEQTRRRLRPQPDQRALGHAPLQILPPAPAGMDAGSPLYARLTAQLGGEPHAVFTARQWLRELGEQARMELAR